MVLNRKLEIAYSLSCIYCPRRSCHTHRLESRHSLEWVVEWVEWVGGKMEEEGKTADSSRWYDSATL